MVMSKLLAARQVIEKALSISFPYICPANTEIERWDLMCIIIVDGEIGGWCISL